MRTFTFLLLLVVIIDFMVESINLYNRYKSDSKYKNYTDYALFNKAVKDTANNIYPFTLLLFIMYMAIDIIIRKQ